MFDATDTKADASPQKPKLGRELLAPELRVLGVLIEKSLTTPEQYPLSLNGTKVGCNQKTSREPVVSYEDRGVGIALKDLIALKLVREIYPPDRGAVKYEHSMGQTLDLRQPAFCLLAVLMLRGAQTPGELRQNVQRMQAFDDVAHVEEALERLCARELVLKIHRAPGQREDRYVQLLGGLDAAHKIAAAAPAYQHSVLPAASQELTDLRQELADLRARVEALEAGHTAEATR
jgi:uncharacterized protein